MEEGTVGGDPVSLRQAWEVGFSWMTIEDSIDPVIACEAMLLQACDGNSDRAAEQAAGVLTTLIVAWSHLMGLSPRAMADDLFKGLVDDEYWPKVQARLRERMAQIVREGP